MRTESFGKVLYRITFIDNYLRYTYVDFLQNKSAALFHFIRYKTLVENQTSKKIIFLRSDNGVEFTFTNFNTFCMDHGIQRHLTFPYNPSQNGVSERKNKTLIESA